MENQFKVGELVWAKMKGFPAWPGRVVKPGPNVKKPPRKNMQWVYFFGTYNHAWIDDFNITPYEDHKEKFTNASKTPNFKRAVQDIREFIDMRKEDPNFELTPTVLFDNKGGETKLKDAVPTSPAPITSVEVSKKRSIDSPKVPSPKRRKASSKSNDENGVSSDDSEPNREKSPETTADGENGSNDKVTTSPLRFGFLGLGNIGSAVVKNLINSGHRLNIYNRTPEKCTKIKEYADANVAGLVTICDITFDVVQNSDIIFSCLSDPNTAKRNVQGNCGVVHIAADMNALEKKGYVEMTGIDPDSSKDIRETIVKYGGRYLEAQIQGSKTEAEKGNLVILCAGDKTLFDDCQSCLRAMGKTAFYLGQTGFATKVNLILQHIKGVALAGLAEAFALADRSGISAKDLLNIFKMTNMANPYLVSKAETIIKTDFNEVEQAIEHMQKDMTLAVQLSNQMKQPLLMGSTANEVYKHARRLGHDGRDAACIYMRIRH